MLEAERSKDPNLWSLVALVVFLAGAIAAHWPQLGGTERLTFSALFLLGPYMLYRANEARLIPRRTLRASRGGDGPRGLGHPFRGGAAPG